MEKYNLKLIFVYVICIVGIIGDDIKVVCKMVEDKYNVLVIFVMVFGFLGNKFKGYKMVCNVFMNFFLRNILFKKKGINMFGDFNLVGEIWIVKEYLKKIGVDVILIIIGDFSYDKLI